MHHVFQPDLTHLASPSLAEPRSFFKSVISTDRHPNQKVLLKKLEPVLSLALYTQLEAVNLDSLGLQLPSFWDRQHPQYFSLLPPEGALQTSEEFGPVRECGRGASSLGWGEYLVMTVRPWEIPARERSQQRQQQSGEGQHSLHPTRTGLPKLWACTGAMLVPPVLSTRPCICSTMHGISKN